MKIKLHTFILAMFVVFLSGCAHNNLAIKGARFEDNSLIALKGYSLAYREIEGRKRAVLYRQKDLSISGEFDCSCYGNPDGSGAGCVLFILDNGLRCNPSVCQDCAMTVSIPSLMGGQFLARD